MTLFTLYYPRREILFVFFIPMPMWVLLSIYILSRCWPGSAAAAPGIGVGIALAGAGFAYAYKQLDLRWSRLISGRIVPAATADLLLGRYEQGRPRGPGPSRTSTSVGGGRQRPRSPSCPRNSSTPASTRSSPRSPATATATA